MDRCVKSDYERWHARLAVNDQAREPWHVLLRQLLVPARDLAGRRVLELACGRGGLALSLAPALSRDGLLVAADFSGTAVAKGAAASGQGGAGAESLRFVVADAQALPWSRSAFDTVISCETLEHVAHPQRVLRGFWRVLRPGGRLFLTLPNYLGPIGVHRIYRRLLGRPDGEAGQPYSAMTLLPQTLGWLKRAGFCVCRHVGVGHYLPWPGRPPVRLGALDSGPALLHWFALHAAVEAVALP